MNEGDIPWNYTQTALISAQRTGPARTCSTCSGSLDKEQ